MSKILGPDATLGVACFGITHPHTSGRVRAVQRLANARMMGAPGHERLITHVFRDNDQYLDSDAVFGVRSTLISDWVKHDAGTAPDGTVMDRPYHTLAYDFVLNPTKPSAQQS